MSTLPNVERRRDWGWVVQYRERRPEAGEYLALVVRDDDGVLLCLGCRKSACSHARAVQTEIAAGGE